MNQYSRTNFSSKYLLSSTVKDYSDHCCDSTEASFLCNACITQSYFETASFSFSKKGLRTGSSPHFVLDLQEKCLSCGILLTG